MAPRTPSATTTVVRMRVFIGYKRARNCVISPQAQAVPGKSFACVTLVRRPIGGVARRGVLRGGLRLRFARSLNPLNLKRIIPAKETSKDGAAPSPYSDLGVCFGPGIPPNATPDTNRNPDPLAPIRPEPSRRPHFTFYARADRSAARCPNCRRGFTPRF